MPFSVRLHLSQEPANPAYIPNGVCGGKMKPWRECKETHSKPLGTRGAFHAGQRSSATTIQLRRIAPLSLLDVLVVLDLYCNHCTHRGASMR